ncbi:MAG TPA: pyridoxamine 5'-phosphate oxidase family protein [Candidatus Dormibacteraeota bacterium]|nr:pyridoxamine 5'-phosphate oxidase family protein [Candidatus Dormibacteraeota bacterium]
MATWAEFEADQPELARRARRLLTTRKHLTMATLRLDGSPRISGTEVQFDGADLRIGSMPGARKALDLRRDARVAIHGPTHDPAKSGSWRGEAKIAGRAVELPTKDDSHAFRIDIEEVVITQLNAARDRLVIESWNPARGYRKDERA